MYWPNAIVLEESGETRHQSTYEPADDMITALNQLCIWIGYYHFNVIKHWIEDENGTVVYEEERDGDVNVVLGLER